MSRVLIASPHHWTSTFQLGTHQLARAFARAGWRVAFVSNPISPLHFAAGRSVQLSQRARSWWGGGIEDDDTGVWTWVPGAILAPHRLPGLRSSWVHRNWHRLTLPPLASKVRSAGFGTVDMLLIDSVIQGFWLNEVHHRTSVLRIGDRMSGFPQFTSEMRLLQHELVRSVDLVAYTARGLGEDIAPLGPRASMYLPNGVDFDHFHTGGGQSPTDLSGIPRPILMYAGAIDEWFDFGTVDQLARARPAVSIVLIGPDQLARSRLTPRPNVHILGPRPYRLLPAYLRQASAGLIPFDVTGHQALVETIHPLKLYEYLACGLPVIAADWPELRTLGSPAHLYRTPKEAVAVVDAVLAASEDQGAGVDFARQARWDNRLAALLSAVGMPA